MHGSLKRLGTDRIDLLQLHGQDYNTPVEETLATLDQLVREGKVRYIGGSNFTGWHLMKALAAADRHGFPRHVAHQVYYSLLNRDYEWELMPLGIDQGVGAVVWRSARLGQAHRQDPARPAGGGGHAGREYSRHRAAYDEERLYRIVDAVDKVAKETGKAFTQVALNWLLQKPTISTVIIGARDEAQLITNIGATGWSLTPEQVKALDAASEVQAAYPVWHQHGFPMLNEKRVWGPGLTIARLRINEGRWGESRRLSFFFVLD